jgi:uncharacterized phage protein (TIGR02220 family)
LRVDRLAATSGAHATPRIHATPRTEARDGSHGRAETTSAGASQTVRVNTKNHHEHAAVARRALDFLNEKTGRNFHPVKANLQLIVARLREGFTETQLRQVIAKKSREWIDDDKMAEYLRPATLFNATKFAQYSGELGTARDA